MYMDKLICPHILANCVEKKITIEPGNLLSLGETKTLNYFSSFRTGLQNLMQKLKFHDRGRCDMFIMFMFI